MTAQFIAALSVSLILIAVYLPAIITHQWLSYKDPFYITQNPAVIVGNSVWATSLSQHFWMPLTLFVYRLEFLLAGLNPVVFHITNMVVHVLGVVCIGLVASRLSARLVVIWLGVLCYGLLPVHVPLIGGSWGLADLLANLFLALACFAGIKFQGKKRWRWLITAIVAVVFLLMSKPLFSLLGNVMMMVVAALCIGMSFVAWRFDCFLRTQEAVIRWLFWLALAGFISMLGITSFTQIKWWKNDITLWSHVAQAKPSVMAFINLAKSLQQEMSANPSQERIDAILKCYDQASALNKNDPAVYLERALFLIRLQQVTQAKKVYEDLLKSVPHHPEALLGLARIYVYHQQSQQVIGLINELMKFYPDEEPYYLKAISLLTGAVNISPNEKIYQEKREDLLSNLEELSKHKKYTAIDFYNLALLYQQVGGREEAVRYYKKALELNPNHVPSLSNLAVLIQLNGDSKSALTLYERVVRIQPSYAGGYLNMGLIYSSIGDAPRAKQMYLKTLKIDRQNSSAYFNLGYILENEGDLKQATEYYEQAIELDPSNAEAYYNLGNVYAGQGLTAEAIASYLKTVDINPKHLNAYVNLAIISFKARDVKGAIAYLEKAKNLGYTPPEDFVRILQPYMQQQ